MLFRFLTSGESHGKALNAIIEGVPAGLDINVDFINTELAKRQVGYGRGRFFIRETSYRRSWAPARIWRRSSFPSHPPARAAAPSRE